MKHTRFLFTDEEGMIVSRAYSTPRTTPVPTQFAFGIVIGAVIAPLALWAATVLI